MGLWGCDSNFRTGYLFILSEMWITMELKEVMERYFYDTLQ